MTSAADIAQSHAFDLTAHLNRMLRGVYVNELQNNPLQPDISYRGYTASPLLGTPQGLSVYLDGMRLNQPFGDVVSWDLIPRAAIDTVTLVPGSDPLFGRNTLGGALSIRTKDGTRAPGSSLMLGYGSFGRRQAEVESGGSDASGFDWYVTGNGFRRQRRLRRASVRGARHRWPAAARARNLLCSRRAAQRLERDTAALLNRTLRRDVAKPALDPAGASGHP